MTGRNGTSARLLTLLSLLQARRDWPGATLAERLDVTPRTVRRDVDRLRELGYPVRAFKGRDGGYRLAAGADLPPLVFDDDQTVALAVSLQLAATSGAGIEEAAARALTTVRQVLPARLRHRVDAVQVTPVAVGGAPGVDPSVLATLTTAVRAKQVLRFDHAAMSGAASVPPVLARQEPVSTPDQPPLAPRRVEPHHLLTRNARWYLLAWDLDHGDWRTFRADRISPRTPTGPRFTPREVPGGDPATFVNSAFKGSSGGADTWPCTGTVELALPASEVAPFAHDGVVEDLGPRHCRLTLGAWSWTGVAAAVARYDTDILSVSPSELTHAFHTLSRRFAAAATTGPETDRQE